MATLSLTKSQFRELKALLVNYSAALADLQDHNPDLSEAILAESLLASEIERVQSYRDILDSVK